MAQLGARFHGMEEVEGSNPSRSTKQLKHLQTSTFPTIENWVQTGSNSGPISNSLATVAVVAMVGMFSISYRETEDEDMNFPYTCKSMNHPTNRLL